LALQTLSPASPSEVLAATMLRTRRASSAAKRGPIDRRGLEQPSPEQHRQMINASSYAFWQTG
jgi:hypothetical protein